MSRDINKAIIESIEMIVDKRLEKLIYNDRMAVVTGTQTKGRRTKYKVLMDGAEYLVSDGVNLAPSVNTKVWVHLPNGSLENAYISALIS